MGQGISKAVNPPPLTLTHCFVDGSIDIGRYYVYQRRRAEQDTALAKCHINSKRRREAFSLTQLSKKKQRTNTPRSTKRHRLLVRDNDGSLREIRPEDTLWYLLYVNQPPLNERMHRHFRARFRIPYESFLNLSEDIINHACFIQWTSV